MPRAKEASRVVTAGARYLRISPSKLNQVAALIRNQHVDEARRILAFTPKAAARELTKVLEAAIANAEHNFDLPADELFVKEVRCDEGPTLKRFRPRAQGRAYRIRKRTSHLHITIERRQPEAPVRRGAGQAGDAEARTSRLQRLRAEAAARTGRGSAGGSPKGAGRGAGRGAGKAGGVKADTATEKKSKGEVRGS